MVDEVKQASSTRNNVINKAVQNFIKKKQSADHQSKHSKDYYKMSNKIASNYTIS